MKEEEFIESKELRDQMAGRIEVLEKVKNLLLIPNTAYATLKQVAEFYIVSDESIQKVIQRNGDELEKDGLLKLSGREVKEKLGTDNVSTQNFRGYFTLNDIVLNNRSNSIFPRRAILRVGMLLRDSEIAKEIRTQLLNIEEKTSIETKMQDINTEEGLMMSVGMAYASGDLNAFAVATTKMMAFKNRHIEKLESDNVKLAEDNKTLATGNLEWSDRSEINYAIRKLSGISGVRVQDLWSKLYQQLLYKHHINVKARGNQPWIQHVKENEWQAVNMIFASMCVAYGTTVSEILDQLKVK